MRYTASCRFVPPFSPPCSTFVLRAVISAAKRDFQECCCNRGITRVFRERERNEKEKRRSEFSFSRRVLLLLWSWNVIFREGEEDYVCLSMMTPRYDRETWFFEEERKDRTIRARSLFISISWLRKLAKTRRRFFDRNLDHNFQKYWQR